MKKTFLLLIGAICFASCASAPPAKTTFLGGYADKLTPGPAGGKQMRWLKPGVDFAKYNKFMVDYVIFALADDSEYKGIDGDEMKKLGDAASLALVNSINEKYPVVTEPGPDVARIKVAIVGLKQSRPVLSGVSSVIPVGLGISVVKKGGSGGWTGSGATTAEMMLLDSMRNEVIAAVHDEYAAGFTERFTKWGSTEEAFKFWAKRGLESLDAAKAAK